MLDESTLRLDPSLAQLDRWTAVGGGLVLCVVGASRRTLPGACLARAGTSLVYRGLTGRWPSMGAHKTDDTRIALAGNRGWHVREAVRLARPIAEVYRFWRQLENLPRFMTHLERVTTTANGYSHWVARGPANVRIEWDAEIVNEVEDQVIGWRSLPGSDLTVAGSVNFDVAPGGRGTQVTVHLQYAPPAGSAGVLVATLMGRAPSQTLREDLRRLKQLLEAGEIARSPSQEASQ